MKKLLTILLTLALTLSLSLPALAAPAEEEYPLDEKAAAWMAAHPEETAQLEAGLDAYVRESWSYESVAEMAENWGMSEEYVRAMLLEEQVLQIIDEEEKAAFLEEYKATHPGELEQFDADAWFQQAYGTQYRPPVEAFMEDYGLTTRQEFEEYMLQSFVDHQVYLMQIQDDIDQALAEDPHILDGFDADAYFDQQYGYYQTPDQFMADYMLLDRQEFETYLSWEYVCYVEETGEPNVPAVVPDELRVMVNGTYLDFDQDQKPYADRGVTYVPADVLGEAMGQTLPGEYVPLRETAEAAGYLVWWDPAYGAAVLLDPAALASEVDSRFTIVNNILNVQAGQRERWKSSEKGEITLTLFDSLNGDQTCRASYTADGLFGPEGAQIAVDYDLSEMLGQMLDTMDPTYGVDPEALAVLKELERGDFELRFDSATGSTAFTASFLPELLVAMGVPSLGQDSWISIPEAAGQDMNALLTFQTGGITVGKLLAGSYETQTGLYNAPALYWMEAMVGAEQLALYLGDDAFTRQGNSWVLEMDPAAMGWYMGSEEFKLKCTFKDSGAVSGSLWVQTPDGGSWSPATRLALEWNVTTDRGAMELEYHIKNQMKLVVNITSTMTETTARPETLPPEDAAVLPAA